MVVGESGLGKSTLVNSLFLTDLYPERVIPDAIGKFPVYFNLIYSLLLNTFSSIHGLYVYFCLLFIDAVQK